MAKTLAYYKIEGQWKKITAYDALQKIKENPREWEDKTFYSTHKPPEVRLKMHPRTSTKGLHHFAYNRGQQDKIETLGKGESLQHILYKEAISELTKTKLKEFDSKPIPITITRAKVEKYFNVGTGYTVDVFIQFKSETDYQLKWDGKLAVEVYYSHRTTGKKIHDLEKAKIPVIEVNANNIKQFEERHKTATEENLREYKNYLKDNFFSESLYMSIKSNPSSDEYKKLQERKRRQKEKNTSSSEANRIKNNKTHSPTNKKPINRSQYITPKNNQPQKSKQQTKNNNEGLLSSLKKLIPW